MPNYNTLQIETLKEILSMHEKHHVDMLADGHAKHMKIRLLQRTIDKVKQAINAKIYKR